MTTGIFGGSFNPIHNGHIALGKAFIEQAGLDELWYVVSPQNPLKRNMSLLDDDLRLQMTQMAVDELADPRIKVSDIEFHLPKPSYMVTTLNTIVENFPDRIPVLLIGEDNWERFPQWYKHDEILSKYRICIYPRENGNHRLVQSELPEGCSLIEAPLFNISSTEIRTMVAEGKSIKGLVPRSVEQFIKKKKLYL
ncbi:MAG: nicotinate (nicotinamide) nucleotide adenylyltransferase [Prevotellaceae bacterium]|nr:nicotinate (nicotinamide) nucleotide adenylyltransferase [Prevotellaceae bacterium]